MGDGRTSKLASQDIGAPFSHGYPLFSHPQAPTGTLLPPITSSTFSLALSLPSCVPGLPSPLAKLPFGPLSRLQARSTFLRILSHSSFIAATWLPRTASWSSIFIYQSSRSRIEAIDRGTTTLQIFYPFFPRSRYHLSRRYFIYFRNTLVPRSRRRFLTILSGLLISNGIVMVIGPRNVLIECLTRARTHTRRRARRRPVRCPFCMRKSYTPREVKFGSGPRCRSAERVSGLETR